MAKSPDASAQIISGEWDLYRDSFKRLSDQVRELRPPNEARIDLDSAVDPQAIYKRIAKSTLGNLLIPVGVSLLEPGFYSTKRGLVNDPKNLSKVTLTHLSFDQPKVRPIRVGNEVSFREYPGETDWSREFYLNLAYGEGEQQVLQRLSIGEAGYGGVYPNIQRDLYKTADAVDENYYGYSRFRRPLKDSREGYFYLGIVSDVIQRIR